MGYALSMLSVRLLSKFPHRLRSKVREIASDRITLKKTSFIILVSRIVYLESKEFDLKKNK